MVEEAREGEKHLHTVFISWSHAESEEKNSPEFSAIDRDLFLLNFLVTEENVMSGRKYLFYEYSVFLF